MDASRRLIYNKFPNQRREFLKAVWYSPRRVTIPIVVANHFWQLRKGLFSLLHYGDLVYSVAIGLAIVAWTITGLKVGLPIGNSYPHLKGFRSVNGGDVGVFIAGQVGNGAILIVPEPSAQDVGQEVLFEGE